MAIKSFIEAAHDAKLDCKDGLDAIEKEYKKHIEPKSAFTGSVDLDDHFKPTEPQSSRWDYGVGIKLKGEEYAVWIEPHSAASASEVKTMLKKLSWLKEKLKQPEFKGLKQLTRNEKSYYWLYPYDGKCRILKGSKEERELARAGLPMPIKKLILA